MFHGLLSLQVIPIAIILMETETHDTLVAGFSMLRDSVEVWHISLALCGNLSVARAFFEVFGVQVKPSLYDYIHVSKFKGYINLHLLISNNNNNDLIFSGH